MEDSEDSEEEVADEVECDTAIGSVSGMYGTGEEKTHCLRLGFPAGLCLPLNVERLKP